MSAWRIARRCRRRSTGKLALADNTARLTDIKGTLGGSEISGRLAIGLGQPAAVEGELALGHVDLPAAIAAATGAPARSGAAAWPSEPFEAGVIGALDGNIAIRAARVALTPLLAAHNVRAVLHVGQGDVSLTDIDGSLADGRVAGDLTFERGADGLAARSRLRIASADAAQLLPAGDSPPLRGRLTLDLTVQGSGRSPGALIGSLDGEGTFTLQDGGVARLDPAAFAALIRATDQGLPVDAVRVGERMESALTSGALPVSLASGEIGIRAGQARIGNMMIRAQGAELTVNGGMDFTDRTIDARLTLAGPPATDSATAGRPRIGLALKGAFDAPRRSLDVAEFASWLALRAVEQQARRLDALESGREQPVAPAMPAAPSAPMAAPAPPAKIPAASATVPPAITPPNGPAAPKRATTPAQPSAAARNPEPKQEPKRDPARVAPPLNLTPPAPRADSVLPWWQGR